MNAPNALFLHPEVDRALSTTLGVPTWRIELAESGRRVAVKERAKSARGKDGMNGCNLVLAGRERSR